MLKQKIWFIYRGEQPVFSGTTKECAEYLNVKESSVMFYATPSFKKRMEGSEKGLVVVDLGFEDDY